MITANAYFGISWGEFRAARIIPIMAKYGLKDTGIDDSSPLKAYVNHGHWLVKCECGGCEFAWEEGIFMCRSCWNAGHAHKFRMSIFPDERKEIEALLLRRPIPNRNWFAHETVAELEAENMIHADKLLEVR